MAATGHSANGAADGSATVRLPFLTMRLRRPQMRIPDQDELAGAAGRVRNNLPSARQCAYFGSLGALAALSVIEWPVAAAIGVGTVIARRAGAEPPVRSGE